MSPSQMFQERIVIKYVREIYHGNHFSFFFFFIPTAAVRNCIYFFSSKSKVMRRHQVMIRPMGKNLFGKSTSFHQNPNGNPEDQQVELINLKNHILDTTIDISRPLPFQILSSSTLLAAWRTNCSLFLYPHTLRIIHFYWPQTHYPLVTIVSIQDLPKCSPQNPRSKGL